MDPGNCFQLLDSQASISDQLYTISFGIVIHTLANWSLVLTTDYCAQ